MTIEIKRLWNKHGNNKLKYYLKNTFFDLLPRSVYAKFNGVKEDEISENQLLYIRERVNYYNKLNEPTLIDSASAISIRNFRKSNKNKVYYFDLVRHLRYFKDSNLFHYLPGDIIHIPALPSLLKSRPIDDDNVNSILLKLNEIRHFIFIENDIPFNKKSDKAVWRGKVDDHKPKRIQFLSSTRLDGNFDFGMVNHNFGKPEWHKSRLTISEQLQNKFIVSIEGNDVASNLKWIMSSNSVCVMCKPKFETWFMEGKLIANHHYIEVKPDFSDLEERIQYYLVNPEKAVAIINNAHEYVHQFKDKKREDLISKLVIQKYFTNTICDL